MYDGPRETTCCWPKCNTSTPDHPLCWHHSLKTYEMVRATTAAIFEHRLPIKKEARQGYVYFLRFHERIKIGYTTDIETRFSQLPHDEVLGYLPGTMLDERRCHAAFAHLRETGEWFRAEADLLAFIASVVVIAA